MQHVTCKHATCNTHHLEPREAERQARTMATACARACTYAYTLARASAFNAHAVVRPPLLPPFAPKPARAVRAAGSGQALPSFPSHTRSASQSAPFERRPSACLAIVPLRSACAELVRHSSPRAVGSAAPQLPGFPVRESRSACLCREKVRQSAEANGVADRIEIRPFAERGPLAADRGATSAARLGAPLPHLHRDVLRRT